jgi:hypothetical protein
VNAGQWRSNFSVVIAGSNGYVSTEIETCSGYSPPGYLGNAAINAPLACGNTYDTYMGYKLFTGVPYDGKFNKPIVVIRCPILTLVSQTLRSRMRVSEQLQPCASAS